MTKRKTSAVAQEPKAEEGLHKRKEFPEHQTLKCDLNDAEVLSVAHMASGLKESIDEAIALQKSDVANYKDKLKALQGRFNELMERISTRQELRDVEVLIIYDYEEGLYIAARQDTGEEIARRPLRENERQQEIPGTSEDDDSGIPGSIEPESNDSAD